MPAHIYEIETDKLANPRCSVGSQTCKLWRAQQKQKNLSDKRLSVCALALVRAHWLSLPTYSWRSQKLSEREAIGEL